MKPTQAPVFYPDVILNAAKDGSLLSSSLRSSPIVAKNATARRSSAFRSVMSYTAACSKYPTTGRDAALFWRCLWLPRRFVASAASN